MKQLTEDAQKRLDKYIDEVRICLKGVKSVDPDEIQLDITEHIANELESAQEPVSCSELESVLSRLGSPQQWVPENELSWYSKMALRLRSGPDDWRLAYITLAVFVLGCITGPSALLLIPLSFFFARITLTIAGGLENLGNQKYLIFPPLACVYTIFTVLVLGFPFLLLGLAEAMKNSFPEMPRLHIHDEKGYWIMAKIITITAVGLWWFIVGLIHRRFPRFAYRITNPLKINRKCGTIIMVIGVLLMVLGISILLIILTQ